MYDCKDLTPNSPPSSGAVKRDAWCHFYCKFSSVYRTLYDCTSTKVTRTPEITISRCLVVSRLIRYGREDCSGSITIVFWTSTFTTAFRRKGLYLSITVSVDWRFTSGRSPTLFRRKRVPPIPLLSAAPTGCSSCLFVRISAQPAESVTVAATNITARDVRHRGFTLPPFLTPNRQFPSKWFR